ncbi:MAG: hypothetical protein AABX29_03465 [Nanoarchaeota archaeon]
MEETTGRGPEHGDIIIKAKEEVVERIEQINRESEEAERNTKKQQYAQELKEELNEVEILANESYVAILRNGGNLPIERLEDAFKVRVTVTKVLEAVKLGVIEPPEKSKYILSALASGTISQTGSVNLFKIVKKYLDQEITFSSKGEVKTEFEKDFDNLQHIDPSSAYLIKQVLFIESDHIGLSIEEIEKKFKTSLEEDLETVRRMGEDEFSNTLNVVFQRYPTPEDKRLLTALIKPEKLAEYMEDFMKKIKDERGYSDDNDLLYVELSERFREKVRMLVGKLFQVVDESSPDKFWDEGVKFGGLFTSIEVVSQELLQRIQAVRSFTFSEDSIMSKIKFYRDEQVVVSLDAEVNPYFEEIVGPSEKKEDYEKRKYVLPNINNNVKIDFDEYFFTVLNSCNDEIETRKFFHDARALIYHPPDPQTNYHKRLSLFAERMTSSNIDHMNMLSDAESILSASQLWAKIYEIDMAMHNWTHQPLTGQVEETQRLTDTDITTLEYLKLVNPNLLDDPWRLKRALIMGIGDNYSISLRALEIGAYADPPLRAGRPIYASYDKRDSVPYRVFNLLAHHNLRWSNEDTWMGKLLFLDLSEREGDHRDLYKDMMRALNSFASGRTDEDLKRLGKGDVVRLIDKINIGKVGGIYFRGSWRMYLYYEGWLIDPSTESGNLINILDSWKALEKIGGLTLEDMVGNLVTDDRKALFSRKDEFFGKKGDSAEELAAKLEIRRQLVEHIYNKYFEGEYKDIAGNSKSLDDLFKDLEKGDTLLEGGNKIDRAEAYKLFFYKGLIRLYRQRTPSKFLTLERRRDVSVKRDTIWEAVRKATGLNNEDFKSGVELIAAVEIALKNDVKNKIQEQLSGRKMHEVSVNYELTEEELMNYLKRFQSSNKKIGDESIENAISIYQKLHEFINTTMQSRPIKNTEEAKKISNALGKKFRKGDLKEIHYLDDIAIKYKDGFFAFKFGVEELQREFLTHRAAGERVVARNTNDNAEIETDIMDELSGYFHKLKEVLVDVEHNHSTKPLIESMLKAKKRMEQVHGLNSAYEIIAKYFVPLTIAFFKKDDNASFFPLNLMRIGKKNCLGQEFVQGSLRGTQPWGATERRNFFVELERAHLLPKVEHDVALSDYEIVDRKVKIFGKEIKIGKKRQLEHQHIEYSTKKIREENASSNTRLVLEKISKYLPILIIAYVAWLIYKSAKDAFNDKSRSS